MQKGAELIARHLERLVWSRLGDQGHGGAGWVLKARWGRVIKARWGRVSDKEMVGEGDKSTVGQAGCPGRASLGTKGTVGQAG